jgi:AraC-like DNA-binding protein
MAGKKNTFDEANIIVRKNYTTRNSKVKHRIHTNDGHELYLLLQGDISFSIDGSIYKLVPYDMLVISNKEIHKTIINRDVPHERIYIYFDPDYLAEFDNSSYDLLQMFENRRHGFGNRINAALVKKYELDSYFEDIYTWFRSNAPEKHIMMLSILLQLIVKVNTICNNSREEEAIKEDVEYNDKIYQIIRYISSNLDKKISLEDLETRFFIDKYYLCHLFKNITGYTVVDYINYKKVLSAKEQLKKGKPISEVWTQFGFLNYSSFYRTFRKMAGMSPTEYSIAARERKDRTKK